MSQGTVKPVPDGYHSATPYLIVDGAAKALDFYKRAFGAVERMRMPGPAGKIGHAEISIGDSVIMLADEHPEMGARGPRAFGGAAGRRARPPVPEWLVREPDRPIREIAADDLQRALASSPAFRLRYHLFLVEAMERAAAARGIPLRTLLVAHGGELRPADPVLAGLQAACGARPDACFDSARTISAAEAARFTFAHDSHWNSEGHRRIGEALAAWLEREPALRRASAGPGG